jgi:hypothetical protein
VTPQQIEEARRMLGLSVSQLAQMLDTDAQSVRRWSLAPDASTRRPVPPRVARLVWAYLAGYRPPDWPNAAG